MFCRQVVPEKLTLERQINDAVRGNQVERVRELLQECRRDTRSRQLQTFESRGPRTGLPLCLELAVEKAVNPGFEERDMLEVLIDEGNHCLNLTSVPLLQTVIV